MENGDTKIQHEQLLESHIMSVDARWLAANIEEVNLSYNQILELLENEAEMFADKSDTCYEKHCQIIAHVEDILHKHQLLAEQYKKLRSCNDNSTEFHEQNGGDTIIGLIGFSNESCFQTPDNKSFSNHVNVEAPSTVLSQMPDGGSSDTSGNEGSQYSAMSSDSDSETYRPSAFKSARSHIDAHRMLENHFVDKEEVDGYEEELSLSRKKLILSESEVSRLQKELEELTSTFESQLDSSQNELQNREIAFEMEKKKVGVLQNQVSILENQIVNSNTKIESLEMELDLAKLKLESLEEEITNLMSCPSDKNSDDSTEMKNQLELAQQQVAILDAKLDGEKRQTLEMQDKIQRYESDITNRDDWIQKLKTVLKEVTDKSCENELLLQSHISSSMENLMLVEASSNKWENRCESLEEQLQQSEADIAEMQRVHEVQNIRWKTDTDLLKTELNEKVVSVEILYKDLDALRGKYDVLKEELDSKKLHILQTECHLHKLMEKNNEMISASNTTRKQYDDVMLKLKDLEKEVQSQHALILDRAEEKREAIRQLCFTLEYYRNRYEELLQTCKRLKSRLIVAS